jgi:dTDP-4-dehydrorhamnose 3,5-epimerase
MTHKITPTSFEGVLLVTTDIFRDKRWSFCELYHEELFRNFGIENDFVQDNLSVSQKWTLRGLHFQIKQPQAKFVSPISWKIYDIIVDLRKDSSTFGKSAGFLLEEGKWIFLPKGLAHGFLALSENTIVLYKCDAFYDQNDEWWIFWYDNDLSFNWKEVMVSYGIDEIILSEKDSKLPTFATVLSAL